MVDKHVVVRSRLSKLLRISEGRLFGQVGALCHAIVDAALLCALWRHLRTVGCAPSCGQLLDLLKFYEGFEINEHTGAALQHDDILQRHCSRLQVRRQYPAVPAMRYRSLTLRAVVLPRSISLISLWCVPSERTGHAARRRPLRLVWHAAMRVRQCAASAPSTVPAAAAPAHRLQAQPRATRAGAAQHRLDPGVGPHLRRDSLCIRRLAPGSAPHR
jgi:hypothetical protein